MPGRFVRCTAGAVAAVVAAVGIGAATVGAAAAPDANLVAARGAAQRILAVTPLPPGAAPQAADPSVAGALSRVFHFRGAQQVIRTAYWTAAGAPASVNTYVFTHPPAGSRLSSWQGPDTSALWQVQWSFRGQTGRVTSELLEINTAPAQGGGTAIRADAIVLWRPTWEQVPPKARAAQVRLDGFAQRIVTGRGLARLRALVNSSPVVAPGAYACPAGAPGQAIRVTFVDGRGRSLAHIGANSADGCGWLSVSVGARRGPALQNGRGLAPRLWAAGSLTHCTAAQLVVAVGAPSVYPSVPTATATIAVHNVARAPCSLKGAPSLELLTAAGRRLPVSDHRTPGPPPVVTAPGRGKVSSDVSWRVGSRRCALAPPASALVGVPGVRHRFDVPLTHSRHRFGPCTGRLGVSALGPF